MKLAAQLYTLRDYCDTPEELLMTLERVKRMGYDGVELESTLIKHTDRALLREKLDDLHLEVCSIRSPFGRTGFDLDGMLEDAIAARCSLVGIGTITGSYCFNQAGKPGYERFASKALEVGEVLASKGLMGLYSLRSHEFVRETDHQWGFDYLEELFRERNIKFEMDIRHLIKAGLDPRAIIKRMKGRVPVIRFRDQRIAVGEVHFFYPLREDCPVGSGVLDFRDYMPAVEEAGTEWMTLGQEYCTRDPFECMEKSLDFMRKMVL